MAAATTAKTNAAKPKKRKKVVSWEQKKKRIGYIFTLPFIIGAVLFLLIPIISSLMYSFSNLNVTTSGFELEFVGWEHYHRLLFVDPDFLTDMLSMIGSTLPTIVMALIFSFFIASLLNQKFHGRGLVRGIFFMPVILSSGIYVQLEAGDSLSQAATETASSAATSGIAAAFTGMLTSMGLGETITNFLANMVGSISDIVQLSAIPIIVFLAGFQAISPSIFEAAHIEGATGWEVFWKISFPMVSPQILVAMVYIMIDSFVSSTNSMVQDIHSTTFESLNYGLGAAMSWFYLLVLFVIIGICYLLVSRLVFYYD